MNVSIIERLIKLTLWLFLGIFISSIIAWRLGYSGFLIVGELKPPMWVEAAIGFVLFYLQFYVMVAYSLLDYSRKQIIRLAVISPLFVVCAIVSWVLQNEIVSFIGTGVFPCLYIMAIAIKQKSFKNTAKRLIFISVLINAFQIYSLFVKNGQAELGYNYAPFLQYMIMSFDLMILFVIIFLKGGVEHEKRKESGMVWKCISFPAPVDNIAGSDEDVAEADKFNNLSGLEKLLAVVILMGFNVLQWGFVMLVIAFIDNIIIEALAVSISYIAFGFIIQRRYHCKTLIGCTIMSFALFYGVAKILSLSISFAYSQFLPIIIGGLLTYSLYRIGIVVDRKANHEQDIEYHVKE